MTKSQLTSLVAGIRLSLEEASNRVSSLGRTRLETQNIAVNDAWHTVRTGTPATTRELDRVKFYDENRIIFVALASDGAAVLINGFPAGPKTAAESQL